MNETNHKIPKFYLGVSTFIILTSVLAIISTIMSSHFNLKRNDLHLDSLVHLAKSQDWWNDYQAHKLREKIYQVEINNVNNTLHQQTTPLNNQDKHLFNQTISKYQSLLNDLYKNKLVKDSLANLNYTAITEEKLFNQSLINFTQSSNDIEIYDFITVLLIIGAGLAGISEIARNKGLAISGFVVGGFGIIVFVLMFTLPKITTSLISLI